MKRYLKYLEHIKKREASTIKVYRSILREFSQYEPLTRKSWSKYLEKISGNSRKTQKLKLTVVKNYLNWKADRGYITHKERFWNDAEPPKSRDLPRYLTAHELRLLLSTVDDPYYRSLFRLLINTGMRISELLRLREDDITFDGEKARIRIRGKGNKERMITIDRSIVESAQKNGVFEKKVSARTIERKIKEYARLAGINKKVTPHTLRHSFAVMLVERGTLVNAVQSLLGHETLTTTGIYLKISATYVPNLV